MRLQSISHGFLLLLTTLVLAALQPGASATGAPGVQEPETDAPESVLMPPPEGVVRLLLADDADAALAALTALETKDAARRDAWTMYRADVLLRTGRVEEARTCLEGFEESFPGSAWRAKARFLRAETARRLGDHEASAAIVREEARLLRGVERRDALAAVYVATAAELSEEANATAGPSRGLAARSQAASLIEAALELETSTDVRTGLLAVRVELAIASADWGAIRLWCARAAEDAATRSGAVAASLRIDAQLAAAYGALHTGDADAARLMFEDIARDLRRPEAAREAWRSEVRASALAGAGDAWSQLGQHLLAATQWAAMLDLEPAHPLAGSVAGRLAEAYVTLERTDDALGALDRVRDLPAARPVDAARPLAATLLTARTSVEGQAGTTADLGISADVRRRRTLLRRGDLLERAGRHGEAIATYSEYVERYQGSEGWSAALAGVRDASFERAMNSIETDEGDVAAADSALAAFAEAFPLDERLDDVRFQRALLPHLAAQRWIEDAEERRAATTLAAAQLVALGDAFSGGPLAMRAWFEAGVLCENELEDAARAADLYRRIREGVHASEASVRLSRMARVDLAITAPRLARTGEAVPLDLYVRNVDEVELHVVALDLAAYFARHGSHLGVADLDLDLIAPDRSAKIAIQDYEPYAKLHRTIEIPTGTENGQPGVWAVSVVANGQRATTLVVRSDVDVIVKRSRDEVFAFVTALDSTGKPQPAGGATVTVSFVDSSSGARKQEVLTTDAGGVARLAAEGYEFGNDTRVFASRGAHVAAIVVEGKIGTVAEPLLPRATAFTDRSLYRAGETVHYRAVLRGAKDGAWTLPETIEGYRIEVVSPEGTVVQTKGDLQLSAYGTLHGQVALDRGARSGKWELRILSPEGRRSATAAFRVGEFVVPRVLLDVTVDHVAVLRGTPLTFTATARTGWGAPIANTPVVWRAPNGNETTVRTDEEGACTLVVATSDVIQPRTLSVRATLPEEGGLGATKSARVATTGLSLALETQHETVVAGATFNATVRAKSADGSGVATELRLVGTRRTPRRGGRYVEETVVDRSFTTDGDGRAILPISIATGGDVTLRVQGEDPFGQLVAATAGIFVSDASDSQVLRVLAERTSLRVGESGGITVLDRSEGGLALLTFEARTILEHRVVALRTGENEISFDALGLHVPDVLVGACAIRRDRDGLPTLASGAATFLVSRPLDVQLVLPSSVDTPSGEGGSIEVEIVTTDGSGRPVAAEVSLALIDKALFQLAPDTMPSLGQVFATDARRTPAFVTAASATFTYEGVTRTIARAILDEAERRESQAQLEQMRGRVAEILEDSDEELEEEILGAAVEMSVDSEFESRNSNSILGVGGGAGGSFGGRFGGKRNLRAAGGSAEDPAASPPSPTAYWNGSVLTDGTGRAKLTIPLPAREAEWSVRAAGVSADHRFGDARASLTSSSPLVVTAGVPPVMHAGDEPRIRAQLSAAASFEQATPVEFELRAERGETLRVLRTTGTIPAGQRRLDATFDALPRLEGGGAPLRITVVARLGQQEISETTIVEIRTSTYPVVDSLARSTGDLDLAELSLPAGARGRSVALHLGATPTSWLVDEALGATGSAHNIGCRVLPGPTELSAELFGAAVLLEAVGRAGGLTAPRIDALRGHCAELASALVSRSTVGTPAARDSGAGATWGSVRDGDDGYAITARCVVALEHARRAGVSVAPAVLDDAAQSLGKALTTIESSVVRARVLWALACLDRVADADLGRMARDRGQLDSVASSLLACALAESGRVPMAADVLANAPSDATPSRGGALEADALRIIARAAAKMTRPGDTRALAARRPWFGSVGRGSSVAACALGGLVTPMVARPAVCEWRVGDERGRVTLNEGSARVEIELGGDGSRAVPVELRAISGGPIDWTATLMGVIDEIPAPRAGFSKHAGARHVLEAPPRYRGTRLRTGFSCVDYPKDRTWRNEVHELEFGASAQLSYSFRAPRQGDGRGWDAPIEVFVPLPAGVVARSDDRATLTDGGVVLSLAPQESTASVTLELVGVTPGSWTLAPVVVRSAVDPADVAYGAATKLIVLAPGETSRDALRATPDELLARGTAAYEANDYGGCQAALASLFDDWRRDLTRDALGQTARMLLFSSLRGEALASATSPNQIVDWFEILKEREPELFVPFDDTLHIADAYGAIGEHERAYVLLRAVIDETFGEDMRVARALDQAGRWLRATRVLTSTFARYPSSPETRDADLALAGRLIDRGLSRATFRGASAEARTGLVVSGIARLHRVLAQSGSDGSADLARADAGLALVSAYVGLEDWTRARDMAELLASAFQSAPRYLDSFRYADAVARWNLADDEGATALLKAIAGAEYRGPNGVRRRSENRDLALYILAQIHHASRDVEGAVQFYGQVEQQFTDAGAALAELRAERFEFGEDVVRVRPGAAAKLALKHKGVDALELRVYPVDLMTLALRERDLSRVTAVDLAGVQPTVTKSETLERSALRVGEAEVALTLAAPGAYLVMATAGSVHRSCLVLVSDLELEVAISGSGSVRSQLHSRTQEAFPRGAEVRVLGPNADDIASGETDPRGLFVAEGFNAGVTVIAEAEGGHYAFFGAPRREPTEAGRRGSGGGGQELDYFKNVTDLNRSNFGQRQENFDKDVERSRKGVQVQQAK